MSKAMFALLLAGALLAPCITPALASEGTDGIGAWPRTESLGAKWDPFRPTPYLDTVPWLNLDLSTKTRGNDFPIGPKLDKLDPLWLQPVDRGEPRWG